MDSQNPLHVQTYDLPCILSLAINESSPAMQSKAGALAGTPRTAQHQEHCKTAGRAATAILPASLLAGDASMRYDLLPCHKTPALVMAANLKAWADMFQGDACEASHLEDALFQKVHQPLCGLPSSLRALDGPSWVAQSCQQPQRNLHSDQLPPMLPKVLQSRPTAFC